MSVHQLIEYMGSMMNAKDDIISNSGKHSLTVSIAYQLQQSSMRRSCACMEDSVLNSAVLTKLNVL